MPASHIFIGGMYRTGTDLLRNILNSADDIAICGETNFFGSPRTLTTLCQSIFNHSENGATLDRRYFGWETVAPGARRILAQVGDISSEAGTKKVVDYIYDHTDELGPSFWWRWLPANILHQEFLQKLLESDRTDRAFFDLLMVLYANGKPIRGEKTPTHIHHVPLLLEWFPNAKFIHMFRDPRAIFVSQGKKKLKQKISNPRLLFLRRFRLVYEIYMSLNVSIHWLRVVQLHRQYQQRYPNNYYLLKFEDLVTDPKTHLEELCRFLHIDFTEKMLQRRVVNSSFTASLNQSAGFDTSAVDRWRQHLHPLTDKWFRRLCQRGLLEFDYKL